VEELKWSWSFFLLFAAFPSAAQQAGFSMAAQAVLDRAFAAPEISFLLLDAKGGLLAQRWPEGIQTPISPGSLVKPWLAIAYGEQHHGEYPTIQCRGTQSHCWYPRGHGQLALQKALADSCNAYFLQLAAGLDRERARLTLAQYNLRGPDLHAPDTALVGLGNEWKETPLHLARAYLALAGERGQPMQSMILRGMTESASGGTAKALGNALGKDMVFAKTGTASVANGVLSILSFGAAV
jgi:cell division protein FtsI/penicillin-binding protein 2